ncbi:FIVAR domain-containing protein [Catenibacterium sp.]|uniref:FIVAR domain-containing protein n=1 Tax=Catenibacterium sp. TaxID=2049022 RepID=UPI004026BB24
MIKEDADTKDLEDLVGSIDKNQKDYTEESWNKLQDALKKAQDVLNKEEPEQSEVDAAYKNLKDSIDGLEKVKDPVITPDKPSKPDENKPGETKPSESKPSETKPNKKPQTSDLTPLASVFSSIFVSLSGIYLVMRKKEC